MKDRVIWFDCGFLPTKVGFAPSKSAWDSEMKRLNAGVEPYPVTDAKCSAFDNRTSNMMAVIITVGDHIDAKADAIGIIGLLVHEVIHAWQWIKRDIGERKPSKEFEAYAVQHMTMLLIDAYARSGRFKALPNDRQQD
jgi:hypothetical protein